jgi:DNA end-binding protein Ku
LPRERASKRRGARKRSAPDAAEHGPARARSMWSGVISFGLVAVPVELFAGSRRSTLSLRMLTSDGTPLARRYVCPEDGRVLADGEIERGYEVADGEFVVVSDEELEQLAPRRSREIALERFVARDEIDPAWFVRSYFLVPGSEQQRAYRLLAETMEQTGRAGIATFVMHGRAHAVAIFAEQGILRAQTLRFGDELRTPADLELPEPTKVPAKLVREMERHIEALAARELDPAELEDDRVERLQALAAQKRERGEDVVEAEPEPAAAEAEEPEGGELIDLMALLKRRLGAKRAAAKPAAKRKGARGSSRAQSADLARASKQQLLEQARALDIPGRSRMTRAQLIRSLRRAG